MGGRTGSCQEQSKQQRSRNSDHCAAPLHFLCHLQARRANSGVVLAAGLQRVIRRSPRNDSWLGHHSKNQSRRRAKQPRTLQHVSNAASTRSSLVSDWGSTVCDVPPENQAMFPATPSATALLPMCRLCTSSSQAMYKLRACSYVPCGLAPHGE